MKRFAAAILAAILIAGAQPKDEAAKLLKAAQNAELVDGNLNAAIKQYTAIASKYAKTDRAAAAAALVRMADCYRKMGDGQSRSIYEQVVRDYSEQKEAAAEARAHLGGVSPSGMISRRVWSGPGTDTYGGVSPDGRYISHVIWRTGALGLYDLHTGTDRELVPNKDDNENAEESVIAKDGRQVAYTFFNNQTKHYELRLANMAGDPNPRVVLRNPEIDWIGPYDWSPDNKFVVAEIQRTDHTAQIGLISIPDGAVRVLKSIDWLGTGRIFFSPDGKYIGYDVARLASIRQHSVFVLAVDGSREWAAVYHPSLNFMMGWSPDGHLLFASDRTGAMGLWGQAMADGKPQGAPELLRPAIGWPEPMGVTRSGALYYSASTLRDEGSHLQVASFDFQSGKIVSLWTDIPHPYGDSIRQPAWSPDGKYLAYLADHGRAGSSNAQNNGNHIRDVSIVIRPADTDEGVRELALKLIGRVQVLRWSSDGRSVFVAGRDFKGRAGIFQVNAQTGEMIALKLDLPFEALRTPVISSDGKTLFLRVSLPGGSRSFVRIDLATGEQKEIFHRQTTFTGTVNLSPDDRWVATGTIDPATSSRLMLLIPAGGGEPRTLMQTSADVPPADLATPGKGTVIYLVGWASDSQSVVLCKHNNEGAKPDELWRAPLNGAPSRMKTEEGTKIVWGPGYTNHIDTGHMAYSEGGATTAHTSEVWVLENFFSKPAGK